MGPRTFVLNESLNNVRDKMYSRVEAITVDHRARELVFNVVMRAREPRAAATAQPDLVYLLTHARHAVEVALLAETRVPHVTHGVMVSGREHANIARGAVSARRRRRRRATCTRKNWHRETRRGTRDLFSRDSRRASASNAAKSTVRARTLF